MSTIGEALIERLEHLGVKVVFGIPGIHTIELYRGLAKSGIRHVTARHEQGAGFMADGYARVSGQAGVAFVITGPGLTNILTPMAQARADSVPILVISSVNERRSLGLGLGDLHELPDQRGLAAKVACWSTRIETDQDLQTALTRAYHDFAHRRPGPIHIEIPKDVLGMASLPFDETPSPEPDLTSKPDADHVLEVADILARAKAPVILAGGGARSAETELKRVAEMLGAPVVLTVNARGLLHRHPLAVPASASLGGVRDMIRDADAVLAVGTELGATDYDMYEDGGLPKLAKLIRVDICPEQLDRHAATSHLCGQADVVLHALIAKLSRAEAEGSIAGGLQRAAFAREAARSELNPDMDHALLMIEAIRDACPRSIIVGDSTQPIYAGNLYVDHDRPGGWFNAATGFGALGYAIPAAIGASLADPDARVICLIGDGGAQFTLTEMLTAVDENLPVTFVIWNNLGYREIEISMQAARINVVGCDPTPPAFVAVARAFGMPYHSCPIQPVVLNHLLRNHAPETGPVIIEIDATIDQSQVGRTP